MTFKEELEMLSETYKSEKLDNVKNILRKNASCGSRFTTLSANTYDVHVIRWLVAQGLEVTEEGDQRQGIYLKVTW